MKRDATLTSLQTLWAPGSSEVWALIVTYHISTVTSQSSSSCLPCGHPSLLFNCLGIPNYNKVTYKELSTNYLIVLIWFAIYPAVEYWDEFPSKKHVLIYVWSPLPCVTGTHSSKAIEGDKEEAIATISVPYARSISRMARGETNGQTVVGASALLRQRFWLLI